MNRPKIRTEGWQVVVEVGTNVIRLGPASARQLAVGLEKHAKEAEMNLHNPLVWGPVKAANNRKDRGVAGLKNKALTRQTQTQELAISTTIPSPPTV